MAWLIDWSVAADDTLNLPGRQWCRRPGPVQCAFMAVRRPRLAHHGAAPPATPKLRDLLGVIGYARRALGLVWTTSRPITIALAVGSVLLGLMPGAMAWTGKRLVDAVVHAAGTGEEAARQRALVWVGVELGLAIALATTSRVLSILRSLLRAQLGNRINVMILDKALPSI
jgi:ATP-binding cassette subfamily B protein